MTSQSDFEKLYDKIISDEQFRLRLAADPEAALSELNISPTPELVAHLNHIKTDVEYIREVLGGGGDRFAT